MSVFKTVKEQGVSLKVASRFMLVISIILTTVLIIASVHALYNFRALERSTDNYIELEEQAMSLMDASDYLTEQVQCYTVLNDRIYMDKYFNEAFEVKRRESAILAIEKVMPDSVALYEIKDSMRHSVNLMDREYYAMRLVMEAKGETDIPDALKAVTLKEDDAKLSPKEKIDHAMLMVHNTDYYYQKNEINSDLGEKDGDIPAVSLSVGVAYSDKALDADVMFRHADAALYYVKQNGRRGCQFYSDELETFASLKLTSISKTDEIDAK